VRAVLLRAAANVVFLDPLPKRPPVGLADVEQHIGTIHRVVPIYLIQPAVLEQILKSVHLAE